MEYVWTKNGATEYNEIVTNLKPKLVEYEQHVLADNLIKVKENQAVTLEESGYTHQAYIALYCAYKEALKLPSNGLCVNNIESLVEKSYIKKKKEKEKGPFETVDENGDGQIDENELRNALTNEGVDDINKIIDAIKTKFGVPLNKENFNIILEAIKSGNTDSLYPEIVYQYTFLDKSINENTVSIKLGREPTKGNSEITVNAYNDKVDIITAINGITEFKIDGNTQFLDKVFAFEDGDSEVTIELTLDKNNLETLNETQSINLVVFINNAAYKNHNIEINPDDFDSLFPDKTYYLTETGAELFNEYYPEQFSKNYVFTKKSIENIEGLYQEIVDAFGSIDDMVTYLGDTLISDRKSENIYKYYYHAENSDITEGTPVEYGFILELALDNNVESYNDAIKQLIEDKIITDSWKKITYVFSDLGVDLGYSEKENKPFVPNNFTAISGNEYQKIYILKDSIIIEKGTGDKTLHDLSINNWVWTQKAIDEYSIGENENVPTTLLDHCNTHNLNLKKLIIELKTGEYIKVKPPKESVDLKDFGGKSKWFKWELEETDYLSEMSTDDFEYYKELLQLGFVFFDSLIISMSNKFEPLPLKVKIFFEAGSTSPLATAGPRLRGFVGNQKVIAGRMTIYDRAMKKDKSGNLITIIHEIFHILGLGTLWTQAKYVVGRFYQGPDNSSALSEYRQLAKNPKAYIPLDERKGHITTETLRNSDWVKCPGIPNEINNPALSKNSKLSKISTGMLVDLGFTVNHSMADYTQSDFNNTSSSLSINLVKGWNKVKLPIENKLKIENLLTDDIEEIKDDNLNYNCNVPHFSTLNEVVPEKYYFVKVKKDCNLDIHEEPIFVCGTCCKNK
jgi:hypothetical protein